MKVKKSLENRIRGWLPHEPKIPSQTANSLKKAVNQPILQARPMKNEAENSPYLLCLFLPIVTFLNIFVVWYYIIVEYLFRGIPPTASRLDMWVTTHYLGAFNPGNYVSLLSAFYLVSLIVGLATSWVLLSPISRKMIRTKEVTVTKRRFMLGAVLDVFVGIAVILVLGVPILGFISSYPSSLGAASVLGSSTMIFYVFMGFIMGCSVMKAYFGLSVFFGSNVKHLALISQDIYFESKSNSSSPQAIRWSLIPKGEKSNASSEEGKSSTL
jgi:hypothetical protein